MKKFIEIVNGVNESPLWGYTLTEIRFEIVHKILLLYFEYPNFKIKEIKNFDGMQSLSELFN